MKEALELTVLNPDFTKAGVVDGYVSLMWARRYYDIGAFDMKIEATTDNINLLKRGNYLTRPDDYSIMRIEALEIDTASEDGNFLIVGGFDCQKILSQRIIWTLNTFLTGTAEEHIRALVTDSIINPSSSPDPSTYLPANRRIDNFQLKPFRDLTQDSVIEQTTYNNLAQFISDTCKIYGWGWKVTYENGIFYLDLYKGTDRSEGSGVSKPVIFSPQFETLSNSKYTLDASNYKNTILIGGEGDGASRKFRMIGELAKGLDRFEDFVDAKSISSNTEGGQMSQTNYYEALLAKGRESLARSEITTSFEGDVDILFYKYGVDYALGDIVTIKNEYNIGSNARIVEVVETWDNEGYSITPAFDELIIAGELLQTPTISLTDIATGKRITFTSPDRGVDFHYTTDGTKPTESSPTARYIDLETVGIYIIQVIAVKGQQQSAVALRNVEILQVATPVFTIENDWGGKRAKFPTSTAGATVYYTIDGTAPDNTKTAGSSYLVNYATNGVTIKAIAYREGYVKSEVVISISIRVEKISAPYWERHNEGINWWYHINWLRWALDHWDEKIKMRGYWYQGESATGAMQELMPTATAPDDEHTWITGSTPKIKSAVAPNIYVRAYAQCKGYANSDILTLNYIHDIHS